MNFKDLGLEPELLSAIAAHGYSTPTPIQVGAIPPVLAGHDLLAGAQTGTGKTAAFVLPLLQLLGASAGRGPRALVLAPTRELAAQILESIRVYGANKKLRSRVIFGGVGERPQIDGLRIGCDILVATPGRLLDLANRGLANLSEVQHLVLDEADRMLDMGFIHDIRRIIKLLPAKRQNLMFSATYTPDIRSLAARILLKPVQVEVTPPNSTVERVVQLAFRVNKDDKRHLLVHLFKNGANGEGSWQQALVFTRTKHGANRLSDQLSRAGIRSAAIHGNKSQAARTRALADFKAGQADGARRDGSRFTRTRHPRTAAGRQLRHASCARGLRASDRPHCKGRQRRSCRVARVVGRSLFAAGHRADDAASRAVFTDARIRAHRARAPARAACRAGCSRAPRG